MNRFRFPSRLYPIADNLGAHAPTHIDLAAAMLRAGVPLLQLRAKLLPTADFVAVARAIRVVTQQAGALLLINDRTDIAKIVDADGVHLGQEDLPAAAARDILGSDKIIGVSTHNLAQAQAAAAAGVADYIGFGPIFATSSKERPDPVQGLEGLRRIRQHIQLPIVAIGGISEATMHDVIAAGADAVAMIGAIVKADDVQAKVSALTQQLGTPTAP